MVSEFQALAECPDCMARKPHVPKEFTIEDGLQKTCPGYDFGAYVEHPSEQMLREQRDVLNATQKTRHLPEEPIEVTNLAAKTASHVLNAGIGQISVDAVDYAHALATLALAQEVKNLRLMLDERLP